MQLNQRITPFFSYTDRAQEAAEFYVSILPNSHIIRKVPGQVPGSVLTVEFELSGMRFVGLNAGQDWKFTEAISLSVSCDTQAEIDDLWEKLSDGGREVQCGWLQDKFGMFWQIVPSQLSQWLDSNQSENIGRMFGALMQMTKLDIGLLQSAFDGK
jgi:predicted 3-demethylubiquinone-9 3-methyltransferase (glyoxalase superfamily)